MLLHEQLKQELSLKINKIAESRKPLDKKTALLFGELQELIHQTPTATKLATHLQLRLKKVPYRLLGFLPLVIDVRRAIESTLKKPEYKLVNLLIEEHSHIREENHQLRQEIKALQNLSRYADLEQHFIDLEKTLVEKKAENSLLKKENIELCKVVTEQEIKITELENVLRQEKEENVKLEEALQQEKAKNIKSKQSSETSPKELSEWKYGEKLEEKEPCQNAGQKKRWSFSFRQ